MSEIFSDVKLKELTQEHFDDENVFLVSFLRSASPNISIDSASDSVGCLPEVLMGVSLYSHVVAHYLRLRQESGKIIAKFPIRVLVLDDSLDPYGYVVNNIDETYSLHSSYEP